MSEKKKRLSEAEVEGWGTHASLAELDRLLFTPAARLGGGEVGLGLVGWKAISDDEGREVEVE